MIMSASTFVIADKIALIFTESKEGVVVKEDFSTPEGMAS